MGLEFLDKSDEGAASVAQGEFGFEIDFGHGAVEGGEIEEWVIAEASGASGLGEDLAFDGSVADGEDVPITRCGEDAVVARASLSEGNAGEERDEVEVVALVG